MKHPDDDSKKHRYVGHAYCPLHSLHRRPASVDFPEAFYLAERRIPGFRFASSRLRLLAYQELTYHDH